MKVLKSIIKGGIWLLAGLYILVLVLIHIPTIQNYTGERVAALLSDKLDTKVRIGRVDLGFLNRIIIDDVLIYDQRHKEMMRSARIAVKIEILPLLEKRISISSAQIFGTSFTFYQTSKDTPANYQFVIDALSSKDDDKESTPLNLRINTFIMQRGSISYDRHDVPPTNNRINPSHLHITDISTHLSLKALNKDSVNVIVKKLAFKEQSGLKLDRLSFKAEGNRTKARLHDFNLRMPGTDIAINEIAASYTISGDSLLPGTLKFDGDIAASAISPADFAFIMPRLRVLPSTLTLSSHFSGTDKSLAISTMRIKSTDGGLAVNANGWVKKTGAAPQWAVTVDGIEADTDFLTAVFRVAKGADATLPSAIANAGRIGLHGTASHTGGNTDARCTLTTQKAGNMILDGSMAENNDFDVRIQTTGIDLKQLTANEKLGTMAADVTVSGKLPSDGGIAAKAEGTVKAFDYNGYRLNGIDISGSYDNRNIETAVKLADPNITADIAFAITKTAKATGIKLRAAVNDFAPNATRLSSKWGDARFSADIDADFTATSINDATGHVDITDFAMVNGEDNYGISRMTIVSGFDADRTHNIVMHSDFGTAEVHGDFDYNTIAQSVIGAIKKKLPTIPGLTASGAAPRNNFTIEASISNTDWLERLLGVPLLIDSTLTLRGKIDDGSSKLSVDCTIPSFTYDGKPYRHGDIDIASTEDTLRSCIGVTKVMDNGDNLDLRLTGAAADNNLSTSFIWDNNASHKRMSGVFNAKTNFHPGEDGKATARVEIQPSHININNAVWNVEPAVITYHNKNMQIDRFAIVNGKQHIIVDGTASASPEDTLSVDLKDINVGYVLNLVNFHSVEFDGRASGSASIAAPFGEMAAGAVLTVSDFTFEQGRMGTLNASVGWDGREKQINIDAIADDGPKARTVIDGYVSPARNYIELGIRADGTYIDFLQSFTSSFMRGVTGNAHGSVLLSGPLNALNLTGELLVDGEMTVKPTNCRYFLRGDTVRLKYNEIELRDMPFYDTRGNRGTVNGGIYHQNLKNLSYDITAQADNLLAYNFNDFGDDTFYGTVYADGEVGIVGRSGELNIDIDLTPRRNSSFVYNASDPDAIADQGFVQWYDATPDADKPAQRTPPSATTDYANIPTDIRINFLINCTPDATIKILMDSHTNDYITLNGNGTLRATYYNKGSFNMFGTYVVERGTYGITIQNIMKKNFTFNEGGTIVFGGNPYNAALDLQAIHTVNGVSLSDLNIGNSFSSNTIRVNCLMNITGQPLSPHIEFDLDMPTVSTDEKQMVRSILNSEDEMNQQVIYLLGIGRFYPQEANNATIQDERQQSQTSLAMQSLSSGILSSQINSLLGTVINSRNWNFGANISTGNEGWNNAEYEGLLSGRLLNNRLLINGQFGYRDNVNNASQSFIGDFDIRYLLLPSGNLAINIYNKANDRYFTRSTLNTQGVGLIMKKDFNSVSDFFRLGKKKTEKARKSRK